MKNNKITNLGKLVDLLQCKNEYLSKSDCAKVIDIITKGIIHGLSEGNKTELRGFGTFKTVVNNPRKARNPLTGDSLDVGHKGHARFKAGLVLRKRIDSN